MNCNFCNASFVTKSNLLRHLKKNRCEVAKTMTPLDYHDKFKKIQPEIEQQLTFDGIFKGRESEIRITSDKMISVFDFIKVVGGQVNPRKTWNRILNEHADELGIVGFSDYSQFGKTKATPVINVQCMVKLLFWLPGEMAKQFRSKSAETMIRYLGGDINDLKCLEEIKEIQPENEQQLTFDGIFKGRESEIRITPDKMVSVFDFIKVVGGQINPRKTWADILKNHKEEVVTFCYNLQFPGSGQSKTPVINVQGMVKLLFWLPGELTKQFRSKSAEILIRYLGGDINELKCLEEIEEIQPVNEQQLTFDGIFKGRESEIRITPDKMVSVFDFIKVVGGQINPRKTWADLMNKYKNEIVTFCYYSQFGKAKATPVINVQGMVKLLFWLPGEMAKQFRSKSAETMIRYLGGDLTLIDEIKAIDQMHVENPNNIAQVFREEVNETNRLNYDQINHSKELLSHFGSKTEIFYMLLFSLAECWYLKFGIVNLRCFYERYNEHVIEFGPDICVVDAFQSSDVTKIESEHKNSVFFKQHSIKLPKKSGTGNHVEIYQLSETLTYNKIKQEILKTANDRITDPPPPSYTPIENSSELTKQIEAKEKSEQEREKTKQKQLELEIKKLDQEQEKTKQKQLELEIKKLEFEMMKFNKNV
jgi:hypothetical protein